MSIAASFRRILEHTELSTTDEAKLERHRSQVLTRLQNSMDVSTSKVIGSNSRGSAIRQTSDLDLLVVLRASEILWGGSPKSSSTVLAHVRRQLSERFPMSRIGRDRQAVVVEFSDEHSIDVVPARWSRTFADDDGRPIYKIPDGSGGWMETAPDSHGRFITDADVSSGGRLKNVARIFKFWRQTRQSGVPISGFHVELLMADAHLCRVGSTHAQSFAAVLTALDDRSLAGLRDPLGVSGIVAACGTPSKRDSALTTLSAAASRATAAVAAEGDGNIREARRLWGLVFNGQFPR